MTPEIVEKMCADVREAERERISAMLVRKGHAAAAWLVTKQFHRGADGDPLPSGEPL